MTARPAAFARSSEARRGGGRELVGVVAGAGGLGEREVALEADALGDRGDRRQAELAGELAGGHAGALAERRVLRVADDEGAEAGGVGQAALEDAGIRDGGGVGEGDGAGVEEEADLGHLAAFAALGQRRHRQHVDRARLDGAAVQELERLRGVDRRPGVGAGDDGGDAAGGGGGAGGAEALLVALAGLADLDADVDDAGGEAAAAAVDARAVAFEDLGDQAVVDDEAAGCDPVGLGVDQAGVGESSGHAASGEIARAAPGSLRTGIGDACVAPVRRPARASAEAEGGAALTVARICRRTIPRSECGAVAPDARGRAATVSM